MTYPIVKIPAKFQEVANTQPFVPKAPRKPHIPGELRLSKPNYSSFEAAAKNTLYLFLLIITVYVILGCLLFVDIVDIRRISSVLITFSFLPALFIVFLRWSDITDYLENKRDYKAQIKKEIKHHKEYPRLYHDRLLPEYNIAHTAWCIKAEEANSEVEKQRVRRMLMLELFYKLKRPLLHKNHARIRKGVSEAYVINTLSNRFIGKVHINATVAPNSSASTSTGPLPDILIHDTGLGYSFVIEIDEPYELQYGEPIHCLGDDDERDNYFLKECWGVIRFAEIQFITEPEFCCDFIAHTINKFTLGLSQLPTKEKHLALTKVPCWTREQAKQMEEADFRATYLPSEVLYDTVLGSGVLTRKRRRDELEAKIQE